MHREPFFENAVVSSKKSRLEYMTADPPGESNDGGMLMMQMQISMSCVAGSWYGARCLLVVDYW